MTDSLTAVSTRWTRASGPLIQEAKTTVKGTSIRVDTPVQALRALKEQPDQETVTKVLKYLFTEAERAGGLNLIRPEPISANIAYQLVNTTIPDYWTSFKYSNPQAAQLVRILRNPCGLGALITRLRPLIADCRQKKAPENTRDTSEHIEDLLNTLELLLENDETASRVWSDVEANAKTPVQKKLMWKEYVTQVASGRILSLVAEAEDALKQRNTARTATWLANGNEFASWLGRNIATLMKTNMKDEDSVMAVVDICGKALLLGYTDRITSSIMLTLINDDSVKILKTFIAKMKAFEQRKFLNAVIVFVTKQFFASTVDQKADAPIINSRAISSAGALLHELVVNSGLLKEHLISVLTKSSITSLDDSLATRRSVIATVAQDEDQIQSLLENSIKLFGDSVYVNHTPILQQEALAQTLAITCGYVQRSQPMFLTMMAKSSYHVTGTSNRIGATSPRARFLGIAVGTAISKMVDKPELQLKFDLEGDEAVEAKWYQRLTEIDDKLGKIEDLKVDQKKITPTHEFRPEVQRPKQAKGVPTNQTKPAITEIKGPRIVEVLDELEDEDDDLVPYDKPDSDPEDDNDDPTEVTRNKPSAPVYIRDLIAGLRDQENYDRHQLALATAAPLIRRKASFGTEVIDHIEELATILVGLNDNLDLEGFAEQRQQALIAVLLAKPAEMAQWNARSFFSGDYSLQQRTVILTTLGLGARELAGLKDSSTEDYIPPTPSFPSKQLPPHLHSLYSDTNANKVAKISRGLAKEILSPIAANAADQLTGPNILKVRTFSSRMEVEKRKQKPIPNALAKIVAENFFFPLTGRWWIQARSNSSSDSIFTSTHLFPSFLHTLALLLHASGPSTLSLPQMTRELWDLLLSVRSIALKDKSILNALLFAFLMLLETNEDKERLATEQGKELLETQEWVRMVFEGLGKGNEGGEDERLRVLAAGVIVRCGEVVEKYQRRLVGSMMNY